MIGGVLAAEDRVMEMPSPAVLFAGGLFGLIGFAAATYGWKQKRWQPTVIGAVLMVYPYMIEEIWLLYLIGFALCVALFFFRD
jgi:hypothetical protein